MVDTTFSLLSLLYYITRKKQVFEKIRSVSVEFANPSLQAVEWCVVNNSNAIILSDSKQL